jgi:hypothetical protein
MALWGVPSAVLGFCAGYLLAARRAGRPMATLLMLLAGFVFVVVAAAGAAFVSGNLCTGREVRRVAGMSSAELERELTSRRFGANPFVLAAVAQNPRASASTLRQIATRQDVQLHQKLGSLFDVMGSNTRGLAVMRLVARHPNVDADTLEILSHSDDDYVLSDVALNPKLAEPALSRLERGGPELDRALAHNPKTAPPVLARLSRSSNAWVRAAVATNPGTPADVLEALRHDPVPQVSAAAPMRCAGGYLLQQTPTADGGVQRFVQCVEGR